MAKPEIEAILEWKTRRGQTGSAFALSAELQALETRWIEKSDLVPELADFIPIRIVTIIEVFVRESVRELVDFGSPYIERAEILARNIKIDYAFLSGLQGQKFSIGELVSHTVSTSDPKRILSYFITLMPDFIENLKVSHERWLETQEKWPLPPIIKDYDQMMSRLSRLFTVRHIVTHERPQETVFDRSEIEGFFQAAIEFIEATDWVIIYALKGPVPRTQLWMNTQSIEEMNSLEDQMNDLLKKLKKKAILAKQNSMNAKQPGVYTR